MCVYAHTYAYIHIYIYIYTVLMGSLQSCTLFDGDLLGTPVKPTLIIPKVPVRTFLPNLKISLFSPLVLTPCVRNQGHHCLSG